MYFHRAPPSPHAPTIKHGRVRAVKRCPDAEKSVMPTSLRAPKFLHYYVRRHFPCIFSDFDVPFTNKSFLATFKAIPIFLPYLIFFLLEMKIQKRRCKSKYREQILVLRSSLLILLKLH